MRQDKRFNIRVYAIIINDNLEILLSDERMVEYCFTKFPGGGLKWGEGMLDCLERELFEETGSRLVNPQHFYTTDFFQESSFRKMDQLISVYFTAQLDPMPVDPSLLEPTLEEEDKSQQFRWRSLSELEKGEMTFPIDKLLVERLKRQYL